MDSAFYRQRGKRWLDLALCMPAAVLSAPLALVVAAAVRSRLGSPVIFRQERPGLDGHSFMLYKFRTMAEQTTPPLPDERRLSALGRFLRSTSLDELPALINVIRGEMSLVGPRPLLVRYLERYTGHQARRHEVRPGITGYAQVNGRNSISWEEKFDCDVHYVDNLGLRLDLEILLQTLWKTVSREGISAAGHATMPEFLGQHRA